MTPLLHSCFAEANEKQMKNSCRSFFLFELIFIELYRALWGSIPVCHAQDERPEQGYRAARLRAEWLQSCLTPGDSTRNQSHTFMWTPPVGLPSHSGHHSASSSVPCATQEVLASCLFYPWGQWCICVNPKLPVPPAASSPLVSVIHVFLLVADLRLQP